MTLEEAKKHYEEVAERCEFEASICDRTDHYENHEMHELGKCAADHRQLAEWLAELKKWREVYGICPNYEMCIPECKEGYNAQIAEYKRLLKLAVEDIHELLLDRKNLDGIGQGCNICSYIENCPCCSRCTIIPELRTWRYADEALKLIGEEGENNA